MANFRVATLLAQLMTDLSLPIVDGGLGVDVILGFPELGREQPQYPLGAVTFESDGFLENPQPRSRLGQAQGYGASATVQANLYLYADTEESLLDLVDRLRALRLAKASVTSEGFVFRLTYQTTRRNEPDENPALRYVTTTLLTLHFVN